MVDYRRHEIISGLFVLAALLVFALFAFKVGDGGLFGLFDGPSIVGKSYFVDVKSLGDGAPVKVGGRVVGQVIGIRMVERELTAHHAAELTDRYEDKARRSSLEGMIRPLVKVDFEITDEDLKLSPELARVTRRQDSPLAPHFLELDPGEWSPDVPPKPIVEIVAASELVINTRAEVGLGEVVASLRPVVRKLDRILVKVDDRLLTEKNISGVAALVGDARDAIASAKSVAHELDETLKNGALRDKRTSTLEKIEQIAGELHPTLEAVEKERTTLLRKTEGLIESATRILDENRAEISEVARRLRRSAWHAEMALRKI